MLYTTSLMKQIRDDLEGSLACDLPPAPDIILPHVFSSTHDIPEVYKRGHINCGDVCSRHTLYNRDPYCHHRRKSPHFCQTGKYRDLSDPNRYLNKMLSQSMDSKDRDIPRFMHAKPNQSSCSASWKPDLSAWNKSTQFMKSSPCLCESCPAIGRDTSSRIPIPAVGHFKLDTLNKSTYSSDEHKADDINWLRSSTHSPLPSSTTDLKHKKSSDAFRDRLLYFPSVSNRIILDYKETEHPHPEPMITDQLPRKKTLKFAVPDFLVPILDRSMPSDPCMERRQTLVINAHDNRTPKKRRTFRERLKRMHSNFDSRMWNFSAFRQTDRDDSDELSNSRTRSITANSIELADLRSSNSHESEVSCDECRRVVLNVSGLKFETWLTVLNRHPETLLGNPMKRRIFFDQTRNEYFFDRHRPSFEAIFNYYQYGGRLKRPATVSDDVFLRELEFFEIEPEALESYKRDEGYVPDLIILPENQTKRKLWMLFEYPETSLLAFGFSIASFIFTITSIVLFCVETLPTYAQTHCEPGAKPNFKDPFFIIETLCTIWFTFEIFIRFFSCPSQKKFIKDVKNLIDLAAIVPYYITLCNVLITFSCEGAKSSASLAFLRVIRLIRVFKLTKHSSGLQVLVLTFKESVEGLSLFLVAFIVCILVFSSTIYYVEIDRKGSQIESIPDAFWWAVITMCTVGYGDKVPKGPLGKVVGSVCAVAGVLTLAIPVPIITENFNKFYAHKTGRGRR